MEITDLAAQDRADMERLVAGHGPALNSLMERHGQSIFRFLFRMLGNEDDANDLAQETFVRVFQHCKDFKVDAQFSTWLYTIAGNLARNHHRWRSRHRNLSLDATTTDGNQSLADILPASELSPSETAAKMERARAVRAAVDALPADMREAIVLCEWEELSMNEAAKAMDTTAKAVESRLYRARKLLRESLAHWL